MADYNKILKGVQEDEENVAQLNKQKTTINTLYDTQKQTTTDTYNQQINDSKKEYEDDYRENAVQKKVNEFYIAEEMANMGLTNSGLNRTQITANQLSYANNKANIDRQRQSMVDGLTREMTAMLTDIENKRTTALQDAEDAWNDNNRATAAEIYNSQLEAETEQKKAYYSYLSSQAKQKAAEEKEKKDSGDNLYYYKRAEVDDYGNEVVVYDYNGKEVKIQKGLNPYTRTNNTNSKDVKKYGTFSNGYQPKGVIDDEGVDHGKLTASGKKDMVYGKMQNIWLAADGTKWVWNGSTNEYELYEE